MQQGLGKAKISTASVKTVLQKKMLDLLLINNGIFLPFAFALHWNSKTTLLVLDSTFLFAVGKDASSVKCTFITFRILKYNQYHQG